jgi:hypothetical protein
VKRRVFTDRELDWLGTKLTSPSPLHWSDRCLGLHHAIEHLADNITAALESGETFASIAYRLTYHGLYIPPATLRKHFTRVIRFRAATAALLDLAARSAGSSPPTTEDHALWKVFT